MRMKQLNLNDIDRFNVLGKETNCKNFPNKYFFVNI